jgi:hypothetical protein
LIARLNQRYDAQGQLLFRSSNRRCLIIHFVFKIYKLERIYMRIPVGKWNSDL